MPHETARAVMTALAQVRPTPRLCSSVLLAGEADAAKGGERDPRGERSPQGAAEKSPRCDRHWMVCRVVTQFDSRLSHYRMSRLLAVMDSSTSPAGTSF